MQSAAFVLGLAFIGGWLGRSQGIPYVSLVALVMVAATLLDVIAEADAVKRHGPLVAVWPEHRLYAVQGLQKKLEAQGIPSLARSVHQRALWHFFAPFIPIQILVPQSRAEESVRILEA